MERSQSHDPSFRLRDSWGWPRRASQALTEGLTNSHIIRTDSLADTRQPVLRQVKVDQRQDEHVEIAFEVQEAAA